MRWDYSRAVFAWRHFLNHSVERRSPNIRQTSQQDERAEIWVSEGYDSYNLWDRRMKRRKHHKERVPEICIRILWNLWLNINRQNHKKTLRGQAMNKQLLGKQQLLIENYKLSSFHSWHKKGEVHVLDSQSGKITLTTKSIQ